MDQEEETKVTSTNEEIQEEIQEGNVNEVESGEEVQNLSSTELGKIIVPGNDIMMQIDEAEKQNKNDEEYDAENNNGGEAIENINEENIENDLNNNNNELINEDENNVINENKDNEDESINKTEGNENNNNENENVDKDQVETNSNSNGNLLGSDKENSGSSEIAKPVSNTLDAINKLNKEENDKDKISSIFNYTSIYSSIDAKNDSFDKKKMYNLHQNIERKKHEKLFGSTEKKEEKLMNIEKHDNINLSSITKDNFLYILNNMGYEDITKLKNKLSEIGIYNQFNDVLFDKQNKIIESLIEQKQELERKILFQKQEIKKLRYSVECYETRMNFIRKKTLNDICNRCGISFDQFGYPHRVTVFGKPITKEEIEEKTRIRSNLLDNGLGSKPFVEQNVNADPLEIKNEYFFTKNDYNPHIEDYNESYNRIKELQTLNLLKSTTINEKIILLTKQIKNAEITVRGCINALIEEQRRSSQMKAKYEHAMEILQNLENQKERNNSKNPGNPHHVNGVLPLSDNKELVDTLSKNIDDNTFIKLEEKYSSIKPNYLDKNPPHDKHQSNENAESKENGNKNIPVIYVEEKTNSLNLELLEYKLETLSLLSKICLSDPPPPPLTNEDYINGEDDNANFNSNSVNDKDVNDKDANDKDNTINKNEEGNVSNDKKENEIDETQKSIINEILNIPEGNNENRPKSKNRSNSPSNTNFKRLDIKFSSDCKSLFNSKPTSSPSNGKFTRIIKPKIPLKYKNSVDQIYKNIDQPLPVKIKLPSLSSYENKLKTDIIEKSNKQKRRPYYQSKVIIDKIK